MKNKIECISLIISIVIIFIAIFILNYYTPLIADDYEYSYIFWTDERISSLLDILISQAKHYIQWGGRSVAHTLGQISLMLGKPVFNITNSFMYLLLIVLICKHILGSKKITTILFIGINILVFLFTPVFGQTILWLIGSSNYLWCMVIMLLFLYPYRLYLDQKKLVLKPIFQSMYVAILGLLAGWTNENTSGAILLILILFLIIYKLKNYIIPKWAYIGGVFNLIGFLLMILAPGNYVRSSTLVDGNSLFNKFLYRGVYITQQAFEYLHILGLIFLVLLLMYFYINHRKIASLGIAFIYALSSIAAIYALILSPQSPPRAFFGAMCLMYIAVGIVFVKVYGANKIYRFLNRFFIIIGVILMGITYIGAFEDIKRTYNETKARQIYILEEMNKGNIVLEVIGIKPYKSHNALYGLDDISIDKQFWINRAIAKYYGLEAIQLKVEH